VIGVNAEVGKSQIGQPQPVAFGHLELTNLDCRCADIQRQNSLGA
jgi:hypothetical protein